MTAPVIESPNLGAILAQSFQQAYTQAQQLKLERQRLQQQQAEIESQSQLRTAQTEESRARTKGLQREFETQQADLAARTRANQFVTGMLPSLSDEAEFAQAVANDPAVAGDALVMQYVNQYRKELLDNQVVAGNAIKARSDIDLANLRRKAIPFARTMLLNLNAPLPKDPNIGQAVAIEMLGITSLARQAADERLQAAGASATNIIALRAAIAKAYEQAGTEYIARMRENLGDPTGIPLPSILVAKYLPAGISQQQAAQFYAGQLRVAGVNQEQAPAPSVQRGHAATGGGVQGQARTQHPNNPADYWEFLVRQRGMSPDEATRITKQRFRLP